MPHTTGRSYDHKKNKLINNKPGSPTEDTGNPGEKYEEIKETYCSNKAQHIPHQENFSYLTPRTWAAP
jgi:hypothetical protein